MNPSTATRRRAVQVEWTTKSVHRPMLEGPADLCRPFFSPVRERA
jgi:hypothetical protein